MFHAVDIGPLSYLNMWNFVPSVKTKDFLHRLDVVVFQSSEMASIQCPSFTAKKKNGNTHGVVDCHFGRNAQIVIEEYTVGEQTKGSGCELDTSIDLIRIHYKLLFGGSRSFKIIDVDKFKKPVISACCDMQYVCTY